MMIILPPHLLRAMRMVGSLLQLVVPASQSCCRKFPSYLHKAPGRRVSVQMLEAAALLDLQNIVFLKSHKDGVSWR